MKINTLTFYRFLAASIVVLFHYGRNTALVALAPRFLAAGPEMVSFFFVLSGFVLVLAYFDRSFDPPGYFRSRMVRILPTYLLALLAALFLETVSFSKWAVMMNVVFLQAWFPPYPMSINGPSWSLSVEMFFYLLFPLLLWFIKPKTVRAIPFIIAAVGIWLFSEFILINLFNSPFYKPFPSISNDLIFYFPLSHVSTFLLGVAGGYFYLEKKETGISSIWPARIGGIIAALAIYLCLTYEVVIERLFRVSIPFAAGFFAPLFLLLIVLTTISSNRSSGVRGNQAFVLLGEASYALYIFQRPFHQFFEAYIFPYLKLPGDMAFYFYYFCLILFSIAVYLLVEKPLKRMLKTRPTTLSYANKP